MGYRLSLRRFADERFGLVVDRYHARRQPIAFCVLDDFRFSRVDDRHDGVRGSEVNSDDFF